MKIGEFSSLFPSQNLFTLMDCQSKFESNAFIHRNDSFEVGAKNVTLYLVGRDMIVHKWFYCIISDLATVDFI